MVIGIANLHKKGIVHRDLKLENLMLDSNGYIRIIDYGLARILASDELAMSHCGTAEYFAPEVVRKQGHDRMVDWWATGILIYEMIFGHTPFFNKKKHEMLKDILDKPLVFRELDTPYSE